MSNNLEPKIRYGGWNSDSWIECQHFLVKKKYSSGSTFIDVDEIKQGSRDLDKDFKKSGFNSEDLNRFY